MDPPGGIVCPTDNYTQMTRYEGETPISDPSSLFKPSALSGKLKEEAKRSPSVRLGGGIYGDIGAGSVAEAKQPARDNRAGKSRRG
jgi:hypothetical protein